MLLIGVAIAMVPSFLLFARLQRRFDGLAESVSNMDQWADVVEDKFEELEARELSAEFLREHNNNNFMQSISRPSYR